MKLVWFDLLFGGSFKSNLDQWVSNFSLIDSSSSFFLASSSSCFISSSDFSKFFGGGHLILSMSSWNSAIVEYFFAEINKDVLSSEFSWDVIYF